MPALAAAVLHGDALAALGSAGVRRRGTPTPISLADPFHLGSCTKAMTATLVALAIEIEKGKLDWTTPLNELFVAPRHRIHPDWREVQVRHVLAHRAGLPANPPWALLTWLRTAQALRLPAGSLSVQRRRIAMRALAQEPRAAPGAKFEYSNTGYILLGAILEQLTGVPWEHLIRTQLWQPLGIDGGGFGPPGRKADAPWGHNTRGQPIRPQSMAAEWRVPPVYGPAGTAHLALAEWAEFAALHLRGHAANPQHHAALLRPESFAALHTPDDGEDYAGGWEIRRADWARGDRPGDCGRVLQHDGSNGQWYAKLWLAPEIDFALLAATNQNSAAGQTACEEARERVIPFFLPAVHR